MTPLQLKEPWAPWWIKLIFTGLYLPLAYAAVASSPADDRYVILPPFIVLTYLLFALLFNKNHATITPNGVRTTLRPFPLGSGHNLPRAEIAHLYIAHVRIKRRDIVVEEIHAFGATSRAGTSIDLQSAFPSQQPALLAARQAQQVLNVELYTDNTPTPNPTFKRTFLLWFGLLVLSTALGGLWHFQAQ